MSRFPLRVDQPEEPRLARRRNGGAVGHARHILPVRTAQAHGALQAVARRVRGPGHQDIAADPRDAPMRW